MSKVIKSVGKIFKPIFKVLKVVVPIALAAAAVVFTGGAALGLGGIFAGGFAGAVGGLVGSLGISGALAGALTGSIVSAGFGAAAGGLLGGMKGMQKGALFGAATGGVLGALSPATFGIGASTAASGTGNGLFGNVAASNGLLPAAAVSGVPGQAFNAAGVAPNAAPVFANGGLAASAVQPLPNLSTPGAPAAPGVVGPAPGTPGTGTGNGFFSNPTNMMVAGQLVTGLFSESASGEAARLRETEGERLFSDIYSNPTGESAAPHYPDPRLRKGGVRRFRFNPGTLQVEEVQEQARPR